MNASLTRSFDALVGSVTHVELMDVLVGLTWNSGGHLKADLAYLSEAGEDGDVEDWMIVCPKSGAQGMERVLRESGKGA